MRRSRVARGSERLKITRKSLATQHDTLSVTRRINGLFVESLAIQRELLERTRSLDRKTGGPAPTTPIP